MKPLNYKSEIEEVLKKYNVHITYEDLNKIYLDSSRYYHSTYHINHLLYLIFKNYEYKNIIEKEKDILLLAALFHDIVYIPGRKDNEAKSSERFYYLYHGDISVFYAVNQIILDTAKLMDIDYMNNVDKLSQEFIRMDIDLLLNGDLKTLEYINLNLLRKEFFMYNDEQYKEGQYNFLKKFIELYPENSRTIKKVMAKIEKGEFEHVPEN